MLNEILLFFGDNHIVALMLITLIPTLELRASIPAGIFFFKMHWLNVFGICIVTNILLAPLVYLFIHNIMFIFLKVNFIDRIYQKFVDRAQKKVKPYVNRYGRMGLALFIGVPLPGSGVYTGGLGAYLLGLKFKDYFIASVVGVMIAGTAILLISMFASETLGFLIKVI